jgi:hypothetical protein
VTPGRAGPGDEGSDPKCSWLVALLKTGIASIVSLVGVFYVDTGDRLLLRVDSPPSAGLTGSVL